MIQKILTCLAIVIFILLIALLVAAWIWNSYYRDDSSFR